MLCSTCGSGRAREEAGTGYMALSAKLLLLLLGHEFGSGDGVAGGGIEQPREGVRHLVGDAAGGLDVDLHQPQNPVGEGGRMALADHFREFRGRLMRSILAVVIAMIIAFADSGINLELGFWIGDPEEGRGNVLSDVNFAIVDAFRKQGVQIPFPQRDVRIVHTPAAQP